MSDIPSSEQISPDEKASKTSAHANILRKCQSSHQADKHAAYAMPNQVPPSFSFDPSLPLSPPAPFLSPLLTIVFESLGGVKVIDGP